MTNEMKENLLKLLFNQGQQSPGQNVPAYMRLPDTENDLADKIEDLGVTKFSATPQHVIYHNGWVIAFSEHIIIAMRTPTETYEYNTSYSIIDMYADDNGIYGIVNDGSMRLVYYSDFTVKNADGTYNLGWNISYDITQLLKDTTGDNSPTSSSFCGALKLGKSPLDGRFFIFTCLLNQTYYCGITYQINVGSGNTYTYQRVSVSLFTTNYPKIDDMYLSWGDEIVNYAVGIIGSCSVSQLVGTETLYEIRGTDNGENSSISYITLKSISNCVLGSIYSRRSSTPQIKYRSIVDRFISYVQTGTQSGGWYDGTITLERRFIDDTETLRQTSINYVSDGNTYKNECNIILEGYNIFILETYLTAPDTICVNLGKYVNNIIVANQILEDIPYVDGDLSFSFINHNFNLYEFMLQHNNSIYVVKSVIRGGYNGDPYFDDNSFIPESVSLLSPSNVPVFARDLYNKTIIENTINSIVHVPRDDMNGESNIVLKENLISETNSIIDSNTKEIVKTSYEELYINFIDTYKVIDNNDKWTYQSSATARVVDEISNGFNDYRITNYRINYENGSHEDRIIQHVVLNDNIATITINLSCDGVSNIEFYDENYTTPFATIDLSSYSGAYKLEEKVKIE